MLKFIISILLLIPFNLAFSQGNALPSLHIKSDEQKINFDSLINDYQFTIKNIKGKIEKKKLIETPVNFKDDEDRYNGISNELKDIYLTLVEKDSIHNAKRNARTTFGFPKKGYLIGLYIKEVKTNGIMRIYIRICNDLWYRQKIYIKNLQFNEGNYFYDMCTSIKQYEINYNYLCPDKILKKNYGVDPHLDLEKYTYHKISIKKLNRIIKKYKCP